MSFETIGALSRHPRPSDSIMTLDQLRANTSAYIAAVVMGGTNETATDAIMADIEQMLIDNAPECVKQLGVRLNDLLDADDWNNIEPLLLQIAAHCRVSDGQNT